MKKPTEVPGSPAILRKKQVVAMVGLSASTIYTLQKSGSFPPPVKLSVRAMGWLSADIEHWLAERAAERAA
jgi:prophage regulatory protein